MKTKGKRAKIVTPTEAKISLDTNGTLVRTSVTLTPRTYDIARKMAESDGFFNFSAWISHLLASERDRREEREAQLRSRGVRAESEAEGDAPSDQ